MKETSIPKWKFILLLTVYGIITVAALLGSYFVLRAFHKSRKLRTASNNILVSLSIADGLLAIPSILDIIQLSLEYNGGHPSRILKEVSGTFTLFLLSVIALHVTLMSAERFIAIKFLSRYHTVTKRRARIISIMMWLWAMAVVVALPEVLLRISGSKDFRKFFSTTSQVFRIRWHLVFTAASMFLVPLLIILCTNVYIFTVSYKQRQHVREQGRDTLAMPIIIHDKKVVRFFITVVAHVSAQYHPYAGCHFPPSLLWQITWRLQTSNATAEYRLRRGHVFQCHMQPSYLSMENKEFRKVFRATLKCCRVASSTNGV